MPDRRLARTAVNVILRWLVPVFPVTATLLGLSYCLTPRSRWSASPVFREADSILPMPVWGAAFLIVATGLIAGMVVQRKPFYVYALAVFVGLLIVWAIVFAKAALYGVGSPTAAVWPSLAAYVAVAVIAGLTTREDRP